jgi:uncharacterized membrane protein
MSGSGRRDNSKSELFSPMCGVTAEVSNSGNECWPKRRFLICASSLQLAVLGFVGFRILGISAYPFDVVTAVFYITFVPGYTIIRLLKLEVRCFFRRLLYAIGLSISFIYFVGLITYVLLSSFGIETPFSFQNLVMTISIAVVFLLTAYHKSKVAFDGTICPMAVNRGDLRLFVVSGLLVVYTVMAVWLLNTAGLNGGIVVILIADTVFASLIAMKHCDRGSIYPVALLAISISLLFHTSLVSGHIWGWDVHTEYYFAGMMQTEPVWDKSLLSNTDSMLSIIVLAPVYSTFCSIDLVLVFKVLFPLFFSLVPVGLFLYLRDRIGTTMSFLSVLFFISMYSFYQELPQLGKQEIAELFLVLILLISSDLSNRAKQNPGHAIVLVLFSFSLVVSHYAVCYLFILMMFMLWILTSLSNRFLPKVDTDMRITGRYVALVTILATTWYSYAAGSSPFNTIVGIGDTMIGAFRTDFFNPYSSQGLAVLETAVSTPVEVLSRYVQLFSLFAITMGLLYLVAILRNRKIHCSLLMLGLTAYVVMFAGVVAPYFASSFNISRLYHLCLIFLCPFVPLGIMGMTHLVGSALRARHRIQYHKTIALIVSFFSLYLLSNSGVIAEVVGGDPVSISLSATMDYPRFSSEEVGAASWLAFYRSDNLQIYADAYRAPLFGEWNTGNVLANNQSIPDSYLYLGEWNMITGKGLFVNSSSGVLTTLNVSSISPLVSEYNCILNVGKSSVWSY